MRCDRIEGGAEHDHEQRQDRPAQPDQPAHHVGIAVRQPVESGIEPAEQRKIGRRPMPQEGGAQRRTERQRVEGRNADRNRDRQGELVIETAGDARDERDRNEHRHQHRRRRDDRAGHFGHRRLRGAQRRQAVLELPLDVLHHHDRVVDHESDRQHHAEQAQHVQRKAHHLHHRQCRDQRHRNGDGRNQRGAPVLQEDEDHQDDQAQALRSA